MPHIIVECSANLERHVSPRRLIDELHRAALATGVFPIGSSASGPSGGTSKQSRTEPENGFVAVLARIGAGRDAGTRKSVAADLMRVLEAETVAMFAMSGLGSGRHRGDRPRGLAEDEQPA